MSIIPIIGSVLGGILGGSSAKSAARTQAAASQDAADAQLTATRESNDMLRDFRQEDIARFQPFYQPGVTAQNALAFELGLGERPQIGAMSMPLGIETFTESTPGGGGTTLTPAQRFQYDQARDKARRSGMPISTYYQGPMPGASMRGTETTRYRVGDQVFDSMDAASEYANANATTTGGTPYGGFTATPGYDFRLNQGARAVESGVAARQGLNSGAAMKALTQFGQDYGSNEYGTYLARLGGMASGGINAAGMQGAASQNYGQTMGQNTVAGGNALAQGIAGAGNASAAGTMGMANALQSGIGQGIGTWQYSNMLDAFKDGGAPLNPMGFSGY